MWPFFEVSQISATLLLPNSPSQPPPTAVHASGGQSLQFPTPRDIDKGEQVKTEVLTFSPLSTTVLGLRGVENWAHLPLQQ